MPISEDEFEFKPLQDPQSTMSKAELRKTHKPIMEKRRRARINHCLNEIKSLILEAMNKDPARHSKLEKADILEMAVKHLQNVQRQQLAMSMATDPSVLRKFKNGFNECATEIDNYIDQIDGLDTSMKQRVSAHLQKCIGGIEQVAQFNFPGFNNLPFLSGSNVFNSNQNNVLEPSANAGDQNNNPRIQIPQGLQLIPSRLPSGELALLVPNSNSLPYFSSMANQNASQNIQPKRPSAFATVIPSTSLEISKPLSPPMSPENPTDDLPVRPFEIIRNPSPKGFRPVITKPRPSYVNEDHQVAQVSSTSIPEKHQFIQPMEVKSIKFPIHKYGVEKEQRKLDSPKKIGEPLCIITNQSERYKLAQVKEDSAQFEENLVPRGVKRKFNEFSQQGLLTVASQEYQPSKVFKPYHEVKPNPSGSNLSRSLDFSKPFSQNDGQQPCGSKDDGNNDMWRPW